MTQPSRICTNCGGEKVSVYARICHLCGAESEPTSATESPAESIGTDTPITPVNQTTAISGPFCISCGTQFTSTASFCINCGAPNPKTNPNPVNQIENPSGRTFQASHSLVWLVAFIPLAGLVLDLMLIEEGLSTWWTTPWVLVTNIALTRKDNKNLASQNFDTSSIDSWTTLLIPIYLFKRVGVAGGGYGYAVTWLATTSIWLLFPYLLQPGYY